MRKNKQSNEQKQKSNLKKKKNLNFLVELVSEVFSNKSAIFMSIHETLL